MCMIVDKELIIDNRIPGLSTFMLEVDKSLVFDRVQIVTPRDMVTTANNADRLDCADTRVIRTHTQTHTTHTHAHTSHCPTSTCMPIAEAMIANKQVLGLHYSTDCKADELTDNST